MAKEKKEPTDLNTIYQNIIKKYDKDKFIYGKDVVVRGVEPYPTGIVSFDYASGVGGFPKGRIVELYGPESSGKTSLTFYAIRELQKAGGTAAYIDVECALSLDYMKKMGVDVNNLLIVRPDHGTDALKVAEELIENGINFIVIDSVAALVSEKEFEADLDDNQVGAQARLITKWLRKNNPKCAANNTCIVLINQLREKIGGMVGFGGSSTTTPGGRGIKFWASMRINIRSVGKIVGKDGTYAGNKIQIETVKNKVAIPHRSANINMYFGKGFDLEEDLIDFGVRWGVLTVNGSWYSYKDVRLGQGTQKAADYIRDEGLFDIIYNDINEEIIKIEGRPIAELREDIEIEEEKKTKNKKK